MYSDDLISALYFFLVFCGREKVPSSIVPAILDLLTKDPKERVRISLKMLQMDDSVQGKNTSCFVPSSWSAQ